MRCGASVPGKAYDVALFKIIRDLSKYAQAEHPQVLRSLQQPATQLEKRANFPRNPELFVIVLKHDGILVKEEVAHDMERGFISCHSFIMYCSDIQVNLNDVEKLYFYKELRRRRRGIQLD